MPELAAIGTAVPAHRYAQSEVAARCRPLFQDALTPSRRESLFANAGVGHRRFVEPMEYYLPTPPFSRRNDDYLRHGLSLAEAAIADALARGGASHSDISHLIGVTTTGLLTPSLEARLALRLPFPRSVKRTPLFGAGCAGGAVALARAFEYLKGHPRETVLALSTELCSLSFLPGDGTVTQLVAAALFGDGAAAALLRGSEAASGGGAEILAAESLLFEDSLDVMGWEFGEDGMRLVLSADAPRLVERLFGPAVDGFLERHGARRSDVATWALHPGSRRIVEACEKALGLSEKDTAHSRRFLAEHGNLSSASLLFILRDALESAPRGSLGVAAALGPGFACETLLFRVP